MKCNVFGKFAVLALLILPALLFAQQQPLPADDNPQKIALVIGNSAYTGLTPLANPVNDADDMAAALELIGFTVEKIQNGSLEQMEDAVIRLKNKLGTARNSYGFLFYAGHGIQSGGENYLIPVDANIPSESFLRNRSVALQSMLDELNDAANVLNVVVLDACRDNPFGWGRSGGSRGLAVVNHQPVGSIIVYATSASQQASDGRGRNGLFTSQLLPNLLTPGLEVGEVFRRTGADVSQASGLSQVPAIYNQFFGTAYLGSPPADYDPTAAYVPGSARPAPLPSPASATKSPSGNFARLWTVGASVGTALADPRLVATVRGTIAPVSHLFIEPGLDIGLISGDREAGYFHIYPYVHAAFYYPFGRSGVYACAGGGYLIGRYNFPEGKEPVNTFIIDAAVGGNILSIIDVSYTFKTNFKNIGHKVSLGYTYRFK